MSKRYSPLGAFKALKRFAQSQAAPVVSSESRPVGATIPPAYQPAPDRAQTVCVLVSAWLHGSAVLPDDFDTVPKSAAGIKAHTRPDGGVYIGSFELVNSPESVVLVYGDPAMTVPEAIQASLRFRRELATTQTIFDEHKALGPFAGQREASE